MGTQDPLKTMAEFQKAWMEAWSNATRQTFELWRHMFELQHHFIHRATHHRSHVEISDGPSFTDKYGKRSHDIDPERDV
ncbi:MAG: hypothetical protein ACM33T_00320 [Solirubrobacterales bacterium]